MVNLNANILTAKLNTLEPGEILPGSNYRLEKYLGEGHTSVVWLGQNELSGEKVAIKILRPEASELTKEFFWMEQDVLSALKREGCNTVPVFLESQKVDEALNFIAIEYLDYSQYTPIDQLLEDGFEDNAREYPAGSASENLTSKTYQFNEYEALLIAEQSLDLLNRLHANVGRTYTDMQLKNFLWDRKSRVLKVLDWNHVSLQKEYLTEDVLKQYGADSFEALVQRDLNRFGVYLFRFLTGKGAYEKGETEKALEERGGEAWKNISLGLRRIITKALHPIPSNKFHHASEFLNEITSLRSLWERKDMDLVKTFLAALKDAEALVQQNADTNKVVFNPADEAHFRHRISRAAVEFDIFEKRKLLDAEKRESYRLRLNRLMGSGDERWAVGINFFQSGHYGRAFEIWLEEARSQDRIKYWRWAAAASFLMDVELSEDEKERLAARLAQDLTAFEEGKFQPEQLPGLISSWQTDWPTLDWKSVLKDDIGVSDLLNDLLLVALADKVQQTGRSEEPEDWRKSAETAEQAENVFKDISKEYRLALKSAYSLPDFAQESAEMLRLFAAAQKLKADMADIFTLSDSSLDKLRDRLEKSARDQNFLQTLQIQFTAIQDQSLDTKELTILDEMIRHALDFGAFDDTGRFALRDTARRIRLSLNNRRQSESEKLKNEEAELEFAEVREQIDNQTWEKIGIRAGVVYKQSARNLDWIEIRQTLEANLQTSFDQTDLYHAQQILVIIQALAQAGLTWEIDVAQWQENIAGRKASLEEESQALERLKANSDELAGLHGLKKNNSKLQKKIGALESKAMRLVKQKNTSKLEMLVLQAANEGFKEKLERLSAEKENIRKVYEEFLGKWDTQKALIDRLQQKLKDQELLVKKGEEFLVDGPKLQQAIAAFEKDRIGYEAALKKTDADNQVKQKELEQQKQKVAELEANLSKAGITFKKQDDEIKSLKKNGDNQQKDFDEKHRKQADKIALYEAELLNLKANINSLNSEMKKRNSPVLPPIVPNNSAELDALRAKLKNVEYERDNNLRIMDELWAQINDFRAKEAAAKSPEVITSKGNKWKPSAQDATLVSVLSETEKNTLQSPSQELPIKNDKQAVTSAPFLSYVYLPEIHDLPSIDKKTFYTFPPILVEFALSGSFDPMLLSIQATTHGTGFSSRVDLKGEFSFVNSDTVIYTHQPGVWYILIKDVCQAAPNFKVGKGQFDKLLSDIRITYNKKAFQLGEVNIPEVVPQPFKADTDAFTYLSDQKKTSAKKLRNPMCALLGHTMNAETKKVNYRIGDRFPENALRYNLFWIDKAAEFGKRNFPPALITPKFTYRQLEDKEYWRILLTDEFLNRLTPAKEL